MTDDNAVGYRRPPKANRFTKGESGNPRGRPKGSRNIATELKEELDEMITVRESGHPRRISKQRALLKSLMAKGLQGDTRAASAILGLIARVEGTMPEESAPLQSEEIMILKRFGPRVLKALEKKEESDG